MNESRSDAYKKKRRNRILVISLIGILIIVGVGGWKMYADVGNTLKNIYQNVKTENKRDEEVSVAATHPISFALLGIDSYGDGLEEAGGRSDTIIVATVNPTTKTTTLVSIPRDSYTEMINYETDDGSAYYDKITHAFAYDGTEMAINTIQEFLNIPIDYYVDINMQGLHDIVEAVGGIELTSPLTFEFEGSSFVKGKTVTADGWDALAFARMRKEDPAGDMGRQERQKMVIKAVLDKLLSIDSVTNYQKILKSLEVNIKTNLTFDDLLSIRSGYSDALENFNQESLPGEDMYIDDIYYYFVRPEERWRMSNLLRDELEVDQVDIYDLNLSDLDMYYIEDVYWDDPSTSADDLDTSY